MEIVLSQITLLKNSSTNPVVFLLSIITVVVLAMRKCCQKVAEKEFIVKQKKEKDELTETLQYHGHTITTSYLNIEDIRSDDDLREELEVLNINVV